MIIDFNNIGGGATVSVVDNLQSTSTTAALSANQGRVLDEKFTGYTPTSALTDYVQTSAMTSYTPTSGFCTINSSAITAGGNLEIQGGSSNILEEIDTLPDNPVDGAIYNYNGVIVRYVDGAGKWGEWFGYGGRTWDSNNQVRNNFALNYTEIPSSMDGQMILYMYTSSLSNARYFYFDLANDRILVKSDTASTATTDTILHNGSAVTVEENSPSYYIIVHWVGNIINFNYGREQYVNDICDVTTNTGHFELVQEPKSTDYNSTQYSGDLGQYVLPRTVDSNYRITSMGAKVGQNKYKINGLFFNSPITFANSSYNNHPDIWVPTSSGTTGTICVSQGATSAPQFKTVAQALGVDFWTGTQDEYDAITAKSATTLYIIIPPAE